MKGVIFQFLLQGLFFISGLAQTGHLQNQPGTVALSAKDSLLVEHYKSLAWQQPLHAPQRQRYLDSALKIAPRDAYLWQQKGMPLFKQQKYELGMPFLDSAVKYDRDLYLPYRAFMKCIFHKTYRGALADFEQAKELYGNITVMDHPYDFYRALCYLQLNELDTAEILLKEGIQHTLYKNGASWVHPLHWFYLGIVYYEKETFVEALQSFDQALILYKDFSDAGYYKALCLLKKNRKAALDLLAEAYENSSKGFTITEDNAAYESYPYQVRTNHIKAVLQHLSDQEEK